MPSFAHQGISFRYESFGEGPSLLFSHGLGANLDRVRPILEPLRGVRVWIYDNRNHGQTSPPVPRDRLSFEQMAGDMAALMGRTGEDRVIVGGVSMGAAIATAFALRYPESVRALILNRPAWTDHSSPDNLAFAPLLADAIAAHGPEQAFAVFAASDYATRLHNAHPYYLSLLREILSLNDPGALAESYRGIVSSRPFGSRIELSQVSAPCLVCANENDPFHPVTMADYYMEALPKATKVLLPDPAARPEEHAQAFQAAVETFIEKVKPI